MSEVRLHGVEKSSSLAEMGMCVSPWIQSVVVYIFEGSTRVVMHCEQTVSTVQPVRTWAATSRAAAAAAGLVC